MRHNKKFSHLGRTASHRRAMLANMACSLIMHKRIATTIAKAKALRIYIEPLITKSKDDSTHSRRVVFSLIKQKEAVTELFREVAPKIADRPGGYTRILKTGFRKGDAADMCIIELVDYNENYSQDAKAAAEKPKTRRSRSAATAKKSEAVVTDDAVLEDSAAEKKTAAAKKPVAVKKAAAQKPAKAVEAAADKDAE